MTSSWDTNPPKRVDAAATLLAVVKLVGADKKTIAGKDLAELKELLFDLAAGQNEFVHHLNHDTVLVSIFADDELFVSAMAAPVARAMGISEVMAIKNYREAWLANRDKARAEYVEGLKSAP